jgi:predicted ester cyclase
LLADNVVLHNFGAVVEGREAWKQTMTPFFTGFPDLDVPIEFTVAEGDKIAVRWRATGMHTGDFRAIAPTGKRISIAGVAVARVAGGKIVEIWSQPDTLGLLQQLGVIPAAG